MSSAPRSLTMSCNLCGPDERKPFKAPYDDVGVALMREHLRSDHNVTTYPKMKGDYV
jgi:hypothetical protein